METLSPSWLIQPLNATHDVRQFDCGQTDLNRWLREQARQSARRSLAQTFVLTSLHAPVEILACYALVMGEYRNESIAKYPRHLPAARLGRFAVQKEFQGHGMGRYLLGSALRQIAELSEKIACAVLVVDAKDPQTADFYCRHGFTPSPANALQLFLPTATLCQYKKSALQ
jgi:GNAT superfamily N-acetyltransferase